MVAHIVLVTWGYAGGSLLRIPATFWNLTREYAGILLSVAGTACLAMVVVTSVRTARRRLRCESWHLLHLYAYLGVGLALPHQLWTGQEFLASPAAAVYWWTLWATAAGAVLVWRVGLPVWRTVVTRTRSPQHPMGAGCGSASRHSVTTRPCWRSCVGGPGSSSRARTAGSAPVPPPVVGSS